MNEGAVARALNEARIRLQTAVDECGECTGGVVTLYGPNATQDAAANFRGLNPTVTKEACPCCAGDREFLARCAQFFGPIVVDSKESLRLALGDSNALVVELPSSES